MGVPIIDNLDLLQPKPLDSKMVWTGVATNLNNVPNKYVGLITYVTGDKNLYLYQAGNINSLIAWEKIVTTNVDTPNIITSDTTLDLTHNGQVLQVNSPSLVNINLPTSSTSIHIGYNVTFVQIGDGPIQFNSAPPGFTPVFNLRNRLDFTVSAGKYAVVSILRLGSTADVLLYGDLV